MGGQKTEASAPVAGLTVDTDAGTEMQDSADAPWSSAGRPAPGIDGLGLWGNCGKTLPGKEAGPFGHITRTWHSLPRDLGCTDTDTASYLKPLGATDWPDTWGKQGRSWWWEQEKTVTFVVKWSE